MSPYHNLFVLLESEINQYNVIHDTTTVLQQSLPEPIFLKNINFHKFLALKVSIKCSSKEKY